MVITAKDIINHPAGRTAIGILFTLGAFLIPHFWKIVIIAVCIMVMIGAIWNLIHRKNPTTLGDPEWTALLIFEIIGVRAILYFARDFLFTFE